MSRSARNSEASVLLLQHVENGATGRLIAAGLRGDPKIYLLQGQLMAALDDEDEPRLVRLAHLRGGLTDGQVESLCQALEQGESVFGRLLDAVPAELLDQLLLDRFRHNLAAFVGSTGVPRFEPLRTVMVNNLQMGHDTLQIIEEAGQLFDKSASLPRDAQVCRGERPPTNKEQRIVGVRLSATPREVGELLDELPLEKLIAASVLHQMLEAGTAQIFESEPVDAQAPAHRVDPPVDEEEDEEDGDDDALTEMVNRAAFQLHLDPVDPVDDSPPPTTPPQDIEADLLPAEADLLPEPDALSSPEADLLPDPDEDPPTAEAIDDPLANLASLDDWLDSATTVDEDELEFFYDHDHARGADGDGKFSTEQHNLDKVEVHAMDDELIEADEAPVARFSAPVLSEHEALDKIVVANDVLATVVQAFDQAEGTGRGRAAVQLLIDGSPSRYASLVQDIQVQDDGRLPDSDLLHNLYGHPPGEHRQLINQGLVDLIERALSSAADDLPDEAFDRMLETVAGYRQRLGL